MQLLQKAAVSIWIGSMDSAWLSRTLCHNSKRNLLSVCAEDGAELSFKNIALKDSPPLSLNDNKASEKNLDLNQLEHNVILKVMTASMKQPKMKLR